MTEEKMIAYCVRCKEKRPMKNPTAVYTAAGTPGTRGQCEVCEANMFKMGQTPAHEGLPKPPPKPKASKKKKPQRPTRKRRGKLVIVESPAKARTIGKYLGKGYKVKASVGHVRDLLRSQLSVDVENDFKPKYRIPNEKRSLVKELRKDVAGAAEIFLATDADREGEAIAWHLMEATDMEPERTKRVVFHEITQEAIKEAFETPRELDHRRVDAQQARRILDRLVGYKISPLLWQRVRNRTSAGRVQSVALRLVCERETEIDAFDSQEYWSIETLLGKQDPAMTQAERQFTARLVSIKGESVDLSTAEQTQAVVQSLQSASVRVQTVKRGQRRRRPSAPFTTSTLQQEASRSLGFQTSKTMRLAQQLYEGIELASGELVGLITYMRTDSTYVAAQAQTEARTWISDRYGPDYMPAEPPQYKTRSRGAQEAHEAIRPSSIKRTPQSVKQYLSRDQFRLYDLIWSRFMASQMSNALYETLRVDIEAGHYGLRATGSKLKFSGFLMVYEESRNEDDSTEEDIGVTIPDLTADEMLDIVEVLPHQHFTQPPPRYTEASLVKALEEHGVGRPSTYAPIISNIQSRGYVEQSERRLYPTEVGQIVNDLLVEYFPNIINVAFTARMEENLDKVAWGEQDWVPVLAEFYNPFAHALAEAEENMPTVEISSYYIDEPCPDCGNELMIKYGRFGKFIGCSNFPDCRYTRPFVLKIGVNCPVDGGELVERKTKKGRIFYGCNNYPECDWTSWKRPLPNPCSTCGGLLVVQNKTSAQCIQCASRFNLDDLPPVPEQDTVLETEITSSVVEVA
jgi:DNA topoisomerase-1